ncbi:hypothetical protein B0H16DRAFT_1788890 [Mycena metata]|uniref:Uncharacterized protein n=1 Tax=Mycena metata TaxID=1033252 RepID=A0AAD7ML48_9AGAR|nr:hypothetical protein B0H16DRAFT_1788890 [Mycena metata]
MIHASPTLVWLTINGDTSNSSQTQELHRSCGSRPQSTVQRLLGAAALAQSAFPPFLSATTSTIRLSEQSSSDAGGVRSGIEELMSTARKRLSPLAEICPSRSHLRSVLHESRLIPIHFSDSLRPSRAQDVALRDQCVRLYGKLRIASVVTSRAVPSTTAISRWASAPLGRRSSQGCRPRQAATIASDGHLRWTFARTVKVLDWRPWMSGNRFAASAGTVAVEGAGSGIDAQRVRYSGMTMLRSSGPRKMMPATSLPAHRAIIYQDRPQFRAGFPCMGLVERRKHQAFASRAWESFSILPLRTRMFGGGVVQQEAQTFTSIAGRFPIFFRVLLVPDNVYTSLSSYSRSRDATPVLLLRYLLQFVCRGEVKGVGGIGDELSASTLTRIGG